MFTKLREFEAMATRQVGQSIGTLRTDRGGEYIGREMENWMKQKGILHQMTTPYTPQQNGGVEWKNQTPNETVVMMLTVAGLDRQYWGEALLTACYVQN